MNEELLSPAKAAEIAECHNDTIRRAIESGFLTAQRVGRNWIIKRSDLQAWINVGKPNHRRSGTPQRMTDDGGKPRSGTGDDQ
jgi:excisionase family DNA binding protein